MGHKREKARREMKKEMIKANEDEQVMLIEKLKPYIKKHKDATCFIRQLGGELPMKDLWKLSLRLGRKDNNYFLNRILTLFRDGSDELALETIANRTIFLVSQPIGF